MDLSQLPETVAKTLEVLSEKLQTPTEKLLEVAVGGVMIEGAIAIGLWVIAAVTTLLVFCFFVYRLVKEGEMNSDNEWLFGVAIATGAVLVIMSMVAIIGGVSTITKILAPEYYLFQQILNFN